MRGYLATLEDLCKIRLVRGVKPQVGLKSDSPVLAGDRDSQRSQKIEQFEKN